MAQLLSLSKTYTKSIAAHATYPDTGGTELTNGTVATGNYTDGAWMGWKQQNPAIVIDLSAKLSITYVRFHYYTDNPAAGVYAPAQLVISGSNDNTTFTTMATYVSGTDWSATTGIRDWTGNLVATGNYRYIKFAFTYATDWLFISELEVYGEQTPLCYITKRRQRLSVERISSKDMLGNPSVVSGSLLTFDGSDASTTITDLLGKSWSVIGGAKLSTTSPKYGSASLSLDGTGDAVSTDHHADFDFGANDFTVDFWLKTTRSSGYPTYLIKRGTGSTLAWNLLHSDGWGLELWLASYSTGSCMLRMCTNYYDGAWHHHAWVRYGSVFSIYFDGSVQTGGNNIGTRTWTGTIGDITGSPTIGYDPSLGRGALGNIDEFRIIKGTALWTGNFTPPTGGLIVPGACFFHDKIDRLNIRGVSTQNQLA